MAHKRAGKFSLGMGQRLGIAGALLGDPGILLFDEPINGLDPEGIRWVRHLLRGLAAEGRTVFVSSHLMSEMALTADQLVVIGRGRLIAEMPVVEFIASNSRQFVRVRTSKVTEHARFTVTLAGLGAQVADEDGCLCVSGLSAAEIGELAAAEGVVLHELAPQTASLEDAFMELTRDSVEFHGHDGPDDRTAGVGTADRLAPVES